MLEPLIVLIAAVVALCASILAVWIALSARNDADDLYQWVKLNNKRSVGLKQLTMLETELTEHADSIKALHDTMHKLRTRVGTREYRARKNADELPDQEKNPEAYKRELRKRAKAQGLI